MSVTFRIKDAPYNTVETWCLCTQIAPTKTPLAERYQYADKECYCKGSGITKISESIWPELNVSNCNARALLRLVGLPSSGDYALFGEAEVEELPNLIRGAFRSLNSEKSRRKEVRSPQAYGGSTCARVFDCGRSDEYLQRRLGELMELFKFAQKKQCPVCWS